MTLCPAMQSLLKQHFLSGRGREHPTGRDSLPFHCYQCFHNTDQSQGGGASSVSSVTKSPENCTFLWWHNVRMKQNIPTQFIPLIVDNSQIPCISSFCWFHWDLKDLRGSKDVSVLMEEVTEAGFKQKAVLIRIETNTGCGVREAQVQVFLGP